MSVSNGSRVPLGGDLASPTSPSSPPSDSNLTVVTQKKLARNPSRAKSLQKSRTVSDIHAPATSPVNAKRPSTKSSKSTPKDAKEARPLTRSATTSFPASSSPFDPLSQHILLKTGADPAKSIRGRGSVPPESPVSDGIHRVDSEVVFKQSTGAVDGQKKKGSFLSLLTMRGGKKKDEGADDDDSDISEKRTDGTNARVFSAASGGGGYVYIPHHKEPPRYIKFKLHHKKNREFNRVFLAQKLVGTLPPKADENEEDGQTHTTIPLPGHGKEDRDTGGAVWALAFSNCGRYLAAGGRDQVVRVFAVLATHEDRRLHEEEETSDDTSQEKLSAPVFRSKPIREFKGHTGEILDLSWSKNSFLLSTAMDRTVRLWHMSRDECLCAFQHKEPVASVAFHPRDDRFFLAGSVDSNLRLWSIPDKSVAYSAQLPEVVTAVAFSPDGTTCMAGTLHGLCLFYETDGLKYHTQIHVRSSRGKNAKGSKITGLQAMPIPVNGGEGDIKVLVTSTDSRIRVYNLKDKSLVAKFKGHENQFTQMRASFSDNGQYIICGSEDKRAYIWSVSTTDAESKDKRPYESFDAHTEMLTAAVFAPTATRRLLGQSGDPIYDLCNPPPVTLLSREEANVSQTAFSEHSIGEVLAHVRKPEESPGYIARSTHYDGNIIVTSDRTGVIKVFRQDCAFHKRRNENWETGSTFSKKLAGGLLGRSGSVLTRTSNNSVPHSRRTSISHHGAFAPSTSSDRILSWRQGIEHNRTGSAGGTTVNSERSRSRSRGASKAAPINTAVANLASGARRQPYSASPSLRSVFPASPASDRAPSRDGPPTPGFAFRAIDEKGEEPKPDGARTHALWSITSRFKGRRTASGTTVNGGAGVGTKDKPRPPVSEGASSEDLQTNSKGGSHSNPVSEMGSPQEMQSQGANGRALDSHPYPLTYADESSKTTDQLSVSGDSESPSEYMTDEGEEAACENCGNRDFKAKKINGRQSFLCSKCGTLVAALSS
ncbi:hypothetical protein jhhlp_000142 [Lomentospora prolificans]|uniref:Uncharacterized protein n=1 Tax=Lomentospora prolificans TaxID=41688 RepID=A0A2N3NLT5_9PEZI|nr:hypothetical protein jhhlp_000142 [Lomentospora prolificans]